MLKEEEFGNRNFMSASCFLMIEASFHVKMCNTQSPVSDGYNLKKTEAKMPLN